MIKLKILIIFVLILNVTLQQEKNYNDVFSEKYSGFNFLWFLYDHQTLEIPTALHGHLKCTQNGLKSCVSVAIYDYPVGYIALSDYDRLNSESSQKTAVYKDNFLLIPYRFDNFNKENSAESNQPALIAKDYFVEYIYFFGISNKENSIGFDPFENINNNSGRKDTLMRVESQYQSQSRNHKSKMDSKNIKEMYTLNTSEKSDTFTNILGLKDFNKNITKRDVKVINKAKIKFKPSTPIESDLRAFLKPEFESDPKTYVNQQLKSDLVQKPTQKEKLEPDLDEKPEPDLDKKLDPNPDLNKKLDLDPHQIPQYNSDEKLTPNSDEKPEPNPDKKPKPDPEECPNANPDEKSDPDLHKNPRPNPNENPETDTDEKSDPNSNETPEPDPKEKLDNNPAEKPELDPGKKPESDSNLKPELNSVEKAGHDPDREPDTDRNQESDPKNQFWNPFTILLVTVGTSVTILVVIVGAYHFGKVRARVDMPILINDIESQIIIPRIRNIRQHPFYSNYL
ncbi:unnamed protein product [Euphydryas editha]|uniref:Uncharacterized protein n=1 Tax=Euphydryas editha TaxID=104508 RepID=A0AAU9TSQ4_EUPED|nr:unnamed protein product [Euphydryas editha]